MKTRIKTQLELDAIQSSWYLDDMCVIRWKRNASGGKRIGDLVGLSKLKSGHRNVFLYVNKKLIGYSESNIVWFLKKGEWPEKEVDHIDGNPQNNKLENLRLATRSEQTRNRIAGKFGRANKGVYKREYGNKWSAQIWLNGICKNLGTFDSEEEAVEIRKLATEMMHKEFANTKSYGLGVQT
jgi:hypothetical protein